MTDFASSSLRQCETVGVLWRRAIIAGLGAAVMFPAGVMAAFLATPLLWRLEGPMGIELAGHSGPSEWILFTAGLIAAIVGGWVGYRVSNRL